MANFKVNPSNDDATNRSSDQAADLIRQKVDNLYLNEPDALDEEKEVLASDKLSKHQKYMYSLVESEADLATIQTKWHKYYQGLSETDKLQVWQEFYDSQDNITKARVIHPSQHDQILAKHKTDILNKSKRPHLAQSHDRTSALDKVTTKGKLKTKHHLQSLLFGLATGFIVVFIFLFGFFNEVIIAPFIQPSRANATTPIILNSNGVAPTASPEVIIPKINVQIPTVYSVNTTDESVIENNLQDGVVHYPTTVLPGEIGNAAFFGHSSNNIFNSGKYKFAFVLLHTLQNNDTFYLTYNSKVYVYQVISKTIVDPSNVSVLGNVPGQTATATLITCDPPGTSLRRLIVVGKQISPDPSGNSATTINQSTVAKKLPADGQTLFGKFIGSLFGKIILFVAFAALIYFGYGKLLKAKL